MPPEMETWVLRRSATAGVSVSRYFQLLVDADRKLGLVNHTPIAVNINPEDIDAQQAH